MKHNTERSAERNKVTHTPTPYEQLKTCTMVKADPIFWQTGIKKGGIRIATVSGVGEENARANAEFIVRSCNSHDELVEALRYIASRSYLASENLAQVALRALAKAEGKGE